MAFLDYFVVWYLIGLFTLLFNAWDSQDNKFHFYFNPMTILIIGALGPILVAITIAFHIWFWVNKRK